MLMFDKIRSKVGKKAHDAKILIKIKSKDFAMSRKITYFAPLPRNRCQEELLIKQFNFKKNNGFN